MEGAGVSGGAVTLTVGVTVPESGLVWTAPRGLPRFFACCAEMSSPLRFVPTTEILVGKHFLTLSSASDLPDFSV